MVYGTESDVSVWPVSVCFTVTKKFLYYSCSNSSLPYNKSKLVVQSKHFSEAEINYPSFCPDFWVLY